MHFVRGFYGNISYSSSLLFNILLHHMTTTCKRLLITLTHARF